MTGEYYEDDGEGGGGDGEDHETNRSSISSIPIPLGLGDRGSYCGSVRELRELKEKQVCGIFIKDVFIIS